MASRSLVRQDTVVIALSVAALVGALGASYFYFSNNDSANVSVLTEFYRHLRYSSEDNALFQRLDQFEFAKRVLAAEVFAISNEVSRLTFVKQQGLKFTDDHLQRIRTMKKQLQEFSCDIDHIFSKLDCMNINTSTQADVRAHRKQLIDWFAAEALTVDDLLRIVEATEK